MPKLNILALSFSDLTKPFRGSFRLHLSSLGALALEGHIITHLWLTTNQPRGSYRVTVFDGSKKANISIMDIPVKRTPSYRHFEFANLSSTIFQTVRDDEFDIIICEKKYLYILCLRLSKLLKCPWVIRVDAFRSLYAKQRFSWKRDRKELFRASAAKMMYIWSTFRADLGICVSKILENWLRSQHIHNICTIEPTYLTIPNNVPCEKMNEILELLPQEFILYIGKPKLLTAMALRTSDIGYAAIGISYGDLRAVAQRYNIKVPSNITCLNLIEDSLLARVYKSAKLVLIPRPFLSGVSMASIEALNYGKPIITNKPTASALRGFAASGATIVENGFIKWPMLVKKLYHNENLRANMEDAARDYFNLNLSPKIHASRMEAVLKHVVGK